MYKQIDKKIEEIIDLFKESSDIEEMIKLKKELLSDKDINQKLQEYERLLVNPYDARCVEIKKELLNDSRFSRYKDYEDKLFLLTLQINSKLKNILKEKSCSK